MKITFGGLDMTINVQPGRVEVLEVEDKTLFARICSSFISDLRMNAKEPFQYWDESGDKLSSRDKPLIIANPFVLPWSDKRLLGSIGERMHEELVGDDVKRREIENLGRTLTSLLAELSLGLEADYSFEIEWELSKYLKAFGFSIEVDENDSLIDNLEGFLKFLSDVGYRLPLLIINLKCFLSNADLDRFYSQIFLSNIPVLLLECIPDFAVRSREHKQGIDLHFLEF